MSRIDNEKSSRKDDRKAWRKPRLERLGTIADIAGPPVPFLQAHTNKFS